MSGALRVLLVDDEPAYVEVLRKRLAKRGVEAWGATSGAAAISALRGQDFDVAVLDLKMGDMDGVELLKVFKKMVPTLPVLVLTGHGSEQAARDGLAAGAFDYLMKPCELDELADKLRAAGSSRQGRA